MAKHYIFILLLMTLTYHMYSQERSYLNPQINVGQSNSTPDLESALFTHFPKLNSNQGGLVLLHKIESPAAFHYTYQQTYQGIPIYQRGLKVTLDKQGNIRAILDKLQNITIQSLPDFSIDIQARQQGLAETYGAYQIEPQAMLYEEQEMLKPVYQLTCYSHGPIYSFEVLIDAQTGEELNWKSLDMNLAHATYGDTTAKGRVFIPNPCTKGAVNYGDLFIDSMDFHKPIFEQLMDTVSLLDIHFENDSFRLKGPFVEIKDLEVPKVAPVGSPDGNFFFRRDESGFEQVMAYYHIDRLQRKIQSLGFLNLHDGPLLVDPQGTDSDNSVTTIKDSMPTILFGIGGVDDAEDADVIIHEYGHVLSYYATRELAAHGTLERLGLDEGMGDYLAATYTQDLGFPNWTLLFNWDGHNEFWPGRIANAPGIYPPADTTIYTFGSIWASALLELRGLLGKNVVDSLFFQEMYMNYQTTDLPQAAQLFLLADTLLFDAAHADEISFIFCEKGLIPNLKGDCAVVSRPAQIPHPSMSIFPNPSHGPITLFLENFNSQQNISCTVYNTLGQSVYEKNLTPGKNFLNLTTQSPGIYHVLLHENGLFIASEKIQISSKN